MSERSTIIGRTFTWLSEDDEKVTLPLRVNMGLWIEFAQVNIDEESMFELFSRLAPDQVETMKGMDSKDFAAMYLAWREAYVGGATPGESEASPSS